MNERLKRRAAFILALSIPINILGGCTRNNNDEENCPIEFDEEFNSEDLTKFLIKMSEITPFYNLEEVFLSESELNELIEASKNNQECDNKSLDLNGIYNSIVANSLDENDLITITDEISLEEKQQVDKLVRECLKKALENMLKKNLISLEDACVMKKLRLIIGKDEKELSFNYYGKDKALVIDYQNLKDVYSDYEKENYRNNLIREDLIRYIELGLDYPRLQTCDCRLEKGKTNRSIGEGNVLDCLIGSAFYNGYNDYNDVSTVNSIAFEGLSRIYNHNTSILLLLAVFKENRNIEDLYEIVFNSDLNNLFKYFGLTTKEEAEEFYQIARTMEILTIDNEYEDEFYKSTTSTYSTAFRDYVGYGYKADIFKTVITDLMSSIASSKDINKEEAIFLYKYVKQISINNTGLNSNEDSFDPSFAKTIIAIENIFFEFFSKVYNLSIEEVDALYEDVYLSSSIYFEIGEDTTYDVDFNKLLEKFPLLQFIETNYRYSSYYLNNFDEQEKRR